VSLARSLLVLLVLLLAAGCAVTREPVVPVIDAARVRLVVDPDGPWHESAFHDAGTTLPAPPASAPAAAPLLAALPSAPLSAPLPVPVARGRTPSAPKGAPPTKPLADVARERFLDHPTEIEADSVTLYAPPSLLAAARLTGASVTEPTPGRRQALGAARLELRELTLVAERITLRTQDSSPDLRIAAKGSVRFVSRQRDQVLREQDLKSLLITNDQLTPLR
jgi:hypothetical protein